MNSTEIIPEHLRISLGRDRNMAKSYTRTLVGKIEAMVLISKAAGLLARHRTQ